MPRRSHKNNCYDLMPNGLAMADNMRAELCCETLKNAGLRLPERGAIIHSDRSSQYTSADYKSAIQKYSILQNMISAGGKCHDIVTKLEKQNE